MPIIAHKKEAGDEYGWGEVHYTRQQGARGREKWVRAAIERGGVLLI